MPSVTAGVAGKAVLTAGAGVLGAAVMAAVDPPKTRWELFLHGATALAGSVVFGPVAVRVVAQFIPWIGATDIEVVVPIYFLVGALSWGVFGAIAKARALIRDRGADAIAKRLDP